MSDLRELTDAESDIVGGGTLKAPSPQLIGIKLVEELVVDILRLLEHQKPRASDGRALLREGRRLRSLICDFRATLPRYRVVCRATFTNARHRS
jgi:hypothetical protein